MDVVSAAVPFVAGAGSGARAGSRAVKAVNTATDVARATNRVDNAASAMRVTSRADRTVGASRLTTRVDSAAAPVRSASRMESVGAMRVTNRTGDANGLSRVANRVDNVSGVSRTANRVDGAAGAARASGGADIVQAPIWNGSGPVSGTLGINSNSTSNRAISNYYPRGGATEFVFDAKTNTFVVGRPKSNQFIGSPHERLAASIGADMSSTTVGGIFSRDANGRILTNEFSGHFGRNWNSAIRRQFTHIMNSYGLNVIHALWRVS